MELTEINKKILAIKEMQTTAVNSLNVVAQNISENNLIAQEEINGLTDSLSSLVNAQSELIGDLKLLLGEKVSVNSIANQYNTLIKNGSASSLFADIELGKFLSISSDNTDFKEAIASFQDEVKCGTFKAINDSNLANIISMINKAVESQEEFSEVKSELFNVLKQNHLMVYIGLSEQGYRFGNAMVEEISVSQTDGIEKNLPEIFLAEEEKQEYKENAGAATGIKPTGLSDDKKIAIKQVEWTGNTTKIAIKKWLGDFLEKDTRTGKWYTTSHFRKIKQLEKLYYLGLVTLETYERLIGKSNTDWLISKGYIAKTVAPVGGFNIISLSNKGAAILNNDAIRSMLYGKNGLRDKQNFIPITEHYNGESENQLIKILAVCETAVALMQLSQYQFSNAINFSYKYIVLKFSAGNKEYGICLCTDEKFTDDGLAMLSEDFEEIDEYAVLVCNYKHNENGLYTNEIEVADNEIIRFTVKTGGECVDALEYLKAFIHFTDLPVETEFKQPTDLEISSNKEVNLIQDENNLIDQSVDNQSEEYFIKEQDSNTNLTEFDGTENIKVETKEEMADFNSVNIGSTPDELYGGTEAKSEYCEEESVETLCKNIINNSLSPKDNAREFYAVIMKLIAENRMWDAIFFLENLAYESDEFKGLADNLKYIAMISEWKDDCTVYSDIEKSNLPDKKYPQIADAIRLASRLTYLTFFERDDYGVSGRRYQIENAGFVNLTVPCKNLLNILSKLDIHAGGYTEQEISAIYNVEERINKFSKRAEELINLKYDGLLDFLMKETFAKDKPIQDCLDKIKNNSVVEIDTVKHLALELFDLDKSDAYVASNDKLDEYLDKIWRISNSGSKKDGKPLKDHARDQAFEYLKERVDFINEWLEFQRVSSNLDSVKENYRKQIVSAAEKILAVHIGDKENTVAANIIKFAAQRIEEFLTGKFFDKAWFVPVLFTNEFLLTKNYMPEDLSCFASVKGLEPWRSVVRHFSQRGATAEHAIEDIEVRKEKDWQGNNTTHKLLCDYLNKEYQFLIDTAKIKPQADIEKKKFEARMETDFLYGRIDEAEKESFFAAERVLFGYMVERHSELGKYKKFLNILTGRVDDIVQVKTVEFAEQIKELENQYSDAPILDNIKLELNKKNFIVAEEYITLLQGGVKEIEKELAEQDDGKSDLINFLSLYDDIYKVANSPNNRMEADFSRWAKAEYPKINKKFNLIHTSSDEREAEQYFDSWKGEGKSKAEKFIRQLGFNVENITDSKKSQFCDESFKVKVSPVPLTRSSYSHPIGAFGTDCKSINVLCFYGENKADRVVKAVEDLNPRGVATIVIFNAALNKNRRETILKEFKQTSQANSFLLIDYVLGFYLALVSKGKRLNTLLQCSIPYTGYKLFSDSVDTLLPEMFIGREQEINKITSLDASVSLVYGGRQLGKTALFKRACAMMNNPREGKYAVYVSVAKAQSDGDNFFVEKVSEELIRCQLIQNKKYETNDEVCKALREKVCRNDTEYLYLFIDEVNDYFEQLNARKDTTALNSYVELKRVSNKRFKFVLAGLHHVQRYSEFYKNNSVVGQMAAPMVVKPLSRIEAIRLIDNPFSYLGIYIDQSFTALIAARANYYPGNIQMICREIAETVQRSPNKPPYTVDDKLLEAVCSSSEINKEIRKKINLTLELDPAYKAIAMLFVFNYYDDKANNRITVDGYSANQVLQMAKEWQKTEVSCLSLRELETLLDELANMSILRALENKSDKVIKTYKLRKSSLAEQIATRDELERYLLGE